MRLRGEVKDASVSNPSCVFVPQWLRDPKAKDQSIDEVLNINRVLHSKFCVCNKGCNQNHTSPMVSIDAMIIGMTTRFVMVGDLFWMLRDV